MLAVNSAHPRFNEAIAGESPPEGCWEGGGGGGGGV